MEQAYSVASHTHPQRENGHGTEEVELALMQAFRCLSPDDQLRLCRLAQDLARVEGPLKGRVSHNSPLTINAFNVRQGF